MAKDDFLPSDMLFQASKTVHPPQDENRTNRDGLQPNSDGLQPTSEAMASNLIAMASHPKSIIPKCCGRIHADSR